MFWPKVKSFQGQSGLVKMSNGGPRHFDRRWATCLGSRELLPWWQSWAGQAAGKKGGPPFVKVAHEYWRLTVHIGAYLHMHPTETMHISLRRFLPEPRLTTFRMFPLEQTHYILWWCTCVPEGHKSCPERERWTWSWSSGDSESSNTRSFVSWTPVYPWTLL